MVSTNKIAIEGMRAKAPRQERAWFSFLRRKESAASEWTGMTPGVCTQLFESAQKTARSRRRAFREGGSDLHLKRTPTAGERGKEWGLKSWTLPQRKVSDLGKISPGGA